MAIVIGGLLGDYLLTGFKLNNVFLFGAACIVLGYVFHSIDQKILSIE